MKAPNPNIFEDVHKKPSIIAAGAALIGLIGMVVLFNFNSSPPENQQPNNQSDGQLNISAGTASFMQSTPDSTEFNTYGDVDLKEESGNNSKSKTGEEYTPTPPEELFAEDQNLFEPNPQQNHQSRKESPKPDKDQQRYEKAVSSGLGGNDNNSSPQQREQYNTGQPKAFEGDMQRYQQQRQQLQNGGSPAGNNPYQQGQPGQDYNHADGSDISSDFKEPRTKYTLHEGTLIPATLQTSINSQLPGNIIGFVNRDVYDTIKQEYLLIPKGTRLIGSYEERVVLNQSKLLMSWDRMIFPDGRSLSLPGLNSYDLEGRSGLGGKVDTHFWKIFGQSAMLSLIGAGANAASPQQQRGFGQPSSPGQAAAQQIAQDFNRTSEQVLERNLQMRPEISIPGGEQFNIFLAGDISFDEPFQYTEPGN